MQCWVVEVAMRSRSSNQLMTLLRCRPRHIYYITSMLLLILCLSLLVINVYELQVIQADHAAAIHASPQSRPPPAPVVPANRVSRPIVWVYGKKVSGEGTHC